jgi:tRNA/tmRNA/rRNA uracil-C5-methylase (TrmA/RlmC/RlmD family)
MGIGVSTTFVSGPSSICFRDKARAPCGTQVIDLFCGSGGMSLGFAMNGYRLVGGADIDEMSIRTYGQNLALAKVADVRVLAEDESELKTFLASLPVFDPAAACREDREGRDPCP